MNLLKKKKNQILNKSTLKNKLKIKVIYKNQKNNNNSI